MPGKEFIFAKVAGREKWPHCRIASVSVTILQRLATLPKTFPGVFQRFHSS